MSTRWFVPVAAVLAMLAIAAPAMAAPTGSQVTTPADPSFPLYTKDTPNTLHVAGTTSGGAGDVDLRCYSTGTSTLFASSVPVVGGSFSADVQLSAVFMSLPYPHPVCTLRAVPAGTTPADAGAFQGPRVAFTELRTTRLGADGGAVNPANTPYDFYVAQTQRRAFNDFNSAGSCGICDTYLFDSATGAPGNPIWWSNGALYRNVYKGPARSSVRIDGVDAYNPSAAATLANTPKDNPGFPELSFSHSVDPSNGDLTIHETNPFVTCAPQPAVYPPTSVSCASFDTAKVTLERTIKQSREGLQVTMVDRWRSVDGLAHQLDAFYEQESEDVNYLQAGHDTRFDFPWTGAGFTAYPAQTTVANAPSAPVTYYVKDDGSTPEAGDGQNPFGSITLDSVPDELIFRQAVSNLQSTATWNEHYLRTVPAGGELTVTHVYSHDYSLASVKALADDAEQALGAPTPAPPAATVPPPPAGPPAAVTPPPAPSAHRCRVPKLRGKTLRRSKLLLRRAHCRLGAVTRRSTTKVRSRRVLVTRPRAGASRAANARVRVVLAR